MPLIKVPFARVQLAKRIRTATHLRPIFMPRDEFETLLHREILNTADSEILSLIEPLMTIRALGQKGALELLFKIGLVLSELDIPSARQDNE